MNGQPASKRRQRRVVRIQRRAAKKPTPTYATHRENAEHFSARMKAVRERVVGNLFSRATPAEQKRMTEKLLLPWKWYSSPEKFFADQTKESPVLSFWKKYNALRNAPILDARKRTEIKQMKRILIQFLNPQMGYVGEISHGGKKTVMVLVARDMTPKMIGDRIRKYLLENPEEMWRKWAGRKPTN